MKYDKNNNQIYYKDNAGRERWYEYDENNNEIHYKSILGIEYWTEYDENDNVIHYKSSRLGDEWFKYDKNNKRTQITEKEYKDIEFRKQEKEYNSRTKCSRFELMEI